MHSAEPWPNIAVACRRLGIVMAPDGSALEVEGVLNPGVTRDRDGRLLLYPRIVAAGNVSRIGLALATESGDTMRIERRGFVLEPREEFELRQGGHGCEDARVTFLPALDRYVMTYTAFGPRGARIALAISEDAYTWERLGLVDFGDAALDGVDNKDAAFFPEPVRSPSGVLSYAFFHRPMRAETINGQTPISVILALPPERREAVCIAYVPADGVKHDYRQLLRPTESARVLDVGPTWGVLKNGAGTQPVRTERGWLSMFHGVDAVDGPAGLSLFYRAGIVINDIDEPHRVVYRSPLPVLEPETIAERFGTVDDVVFPTGIDQRDSDTFDVYYGAADAKISRARLTISET